MAGETQAELEYGIRHYQNQQYEEAAKWLKRSADKGNPLAQFNYGFLLEKGLEFNRLRKLVAIIQKVQINRTLKLVFVWLDVLS